MEAVTAQVELLEAGKPLEAFDAFYDEIVLMYANDVLFASGAAEGRAKQEPFIAAAESISGRIADIKVVDKQVFVFFVISRRSPILKGRITRSTDCPGKNGKAA